MTSNAGSDVSKYETEEGLKEVAAFLRGRNGMPLRPAIEVDKRVEYFKGETPYWHAGNGEIWMRSNLDHTTECALSKIPAG